MDALPQETLDEILSFACDDPQDAASCALVCHSFLPQANRARYHTLNVMASKHLDPVALHTAFHFVKQIVFPERLVSDLKNLPRIRDCVRHIIFHGTTLDAADTFGLTQLLSILPRLREISFHGVNLESSESYFNDLAPGMRQVERLTFKGCILSAANFNSVFSGHRTCRKLLLNEDTSYSVHSPSLNASSVAGFRNLVYLHLAIRRTGREHESESYQWFSRVHFSSLRSLSVDFQVRSHTVVVQTILAAASDLRSIHIKLPFIAYLPLKTMLLDFSTLLYLKDLSFHGAVPALNVLRRSLETLPSPSLTRIKFTIMLGRRFQTYMGPFHILDVVLVGRVDYARFEELIVEMKRENVTVPEKQALRYFLHSAFPNVTTLLKRKIRRELLT